MTWISSYFIILIFFFSSHLLLILLMVEAISFGIVHIPASCIVLFVSLYLAPFLRLMSDCHPWQRTDHVEMMS